MNSINFRYILQKYLVLLALLAFDQMCYGSAGADARTVSSSVVGRRVLPLSRNETSYYSDDDRSLSEMSMLQVDSYFDGNEPIQNHQNADSRVVEAQGLLRYQPRAAPVRQNPLVNANFNTSVVAVQPANANDKADQLIKQSYISPGMQWGVLSIFNDPSFDIQTDTLQIGYIPTIEAIVQQTKLAMARQNANQMMYALYTALQAVDLAIYSGDIEIYYQYFDIVSQSTGIKLPEGWKSLWLSKIVNNKGMEPALKDALLTKRSLVQAEINRIKGGSWSAWLSFLTTTPTLKFVQKNQAVTKFQNNQLQTTDISIIQRLVRANDYSTVLARTVDQQGQAQADLLIAQCFAAQYRPINQDILTIYRPNAINQQTINSQQESLALYAYFPSIDQFIRDIKSLQKNTDQGGVVRQRVFSENETTYIRQLILNLREAINVALLIAQKNSSYYEYIAGSIASSQANPIVTKLLDYEKQLTDCFTTFATDDDVNAEYWRSFIPQITVGKVITVAAAATALAFLFFDINYYRSDYITGDRFKSQSAIDEKQQLYQKKEIEKQKIEIDANIKKQKDTIESLTKKRNQLLKTTEILPSADDKKIVEKEIAATNKQGQAAVTQLNKALDDAIQFATQETTRLTQQFVKNPTPQLASAIEKNQQKIADLKEQKIIIPEKNNPANSNEDTFSINTLLKNIKENVNPGVKETKDDNPKDSNKKQATTTTSTGTQTTSTGEPIPNEFFTENKSNIFSEYLDTGKEYFDAAKYFVTSDPVETAVGTGAAALTGLGLKARSAWKKAAPATTPEQPIDVAEKPVKGAQNPPPASSTTSSAQNVTGQTDNGNPPKPRTYDVTKDTTYKNVKDIKSNTSSKTSADPVTNAKPQKQPIKLKTVAKGGLKGPALSVGAAAMGIGVDYYARKNLGFTDQDVATNTQRNESLADDIPTNFTLPAVQASSTGNIPPITNNVTPPTVQSSSNQ